MIEQFKYAKVGDKVFSTVCGWGVVEEVGNLGIVVKYDKRNARDSYDFTGRMVTGDLYPELYWQEPWVCIESTNQNRSTTGISTSWTEQYWVKEPKKPKDEIKILVNGKEVEISEDTLASIRGAMEQSDG